jgi:hypothetical protein
MNSKEFINNEIKKNGNTNLITDSRLESGLKYLPLVIVIQFFFTIL